ncbi:hypothetical protein D1007_59270 [Hordeum vulgare]|nr:hypothetical protein D1007_59270 [Hordeum vulgare]
MFAEPLDFNDLEFRIVRIETPSGFAIFNVSDVSGPGDELRQLILRFDKDNKELVVWDIELKDLIDTKLGVKCRAGDEAVDELIWGLKHILSDFIPEDKDKLTDAYFLPPGKQLLKDLETYEIMVPIGKINSHWDSIYESGDTNILDILFKGTYVISIMFLLMVA